MQAELAHAIADYLKDRPATGYFPTEIADLVIGRVEKPTSPNPRFSQPQICVNIQGAKQTMLEGRTFDYREMQFLVVSMDLPILGRVMQARRGRPFLGMILNIDMALLNTVMEQAGDLAEPANSFSIGVGDVDAAMADCLKRILDLLKHPKDIPVLYPLIARELYYRLLTGPQEHRQFCQPVAVEAGMVDTPDGNTAQQGTVFRRVLLKIGRRWIVHIHVGRPIKSCDLQLGVGAELGDCRVRSLPPDQHLDAGRRRLRLPHVQAHRFGGSDRGIDLGDPSVPDALGGVGQR